MLQDIYYSETNKSIYREPWESHTRNKEMQHINVIFKQEVDALFSLLSKSTILICEENATFNIRKNSFTLNISIKIKLYLIQNTTKEGSPSWSSG